MVPALVPYPLHCNDTESLPRGGSRTDITFVNVNSILKTWRQTRNMGSGIVGLAETRHDPQTTHYLSKAFGAAGYGTIWSQPAKQGSGGVALTYSQDWVLIEHLELLAHHYLPGHLCTGAVLRQRVNGDKLVCMVVYIPPGQEGGLRAPLECMLAELEQQHGPYLVCMGDFNKLIRSQHRLMNLWDAHDFWYRNCQMETPHTSFQQGGSARPDRFYISEHLLEQLEDCPVGKLSCPPHCSIAIRLRAEGEWWSHTAIKAVDYSQVINPKPIAEHYALTVEHMHSLVQNDVDAAYKDWSRRWSTYLYDWVGTREAAGLKKLGTMAKLQKEKAALRPRRSKWTRRLSNFVGCLKTLQSMPDKAGDHAVRLWKKIVRRQAAFLNYYGTPDIEMVDQQNLEEVTANLLNSMSIFFERKLEAEYDKEKQQDKKRFEERIRQNAGVNKMVTKLLNPTKEVHTTVIQTKDKKLTTDEEIFQELDDTWGKKYYSKEPSPLPEWFIDKYVRPLQPAREPLPELTSDLISRVLAASSSSSTPGPDQWRYADLKQLPRVAIDELTIILQQCETTATWPQAMRHTWVAMLAPNEAPAAFKMRPISLLPSIYRLWGRAVLDRAASWMAQVLPDGVHAYRPQHSAKKAMAALMSRYYRDMKSGKPEGLVLSLDLSKAFPSASRRAMSQIWSQLGGPEAPCGLLRHSMSKATTDGDWKASGPPSEQRG